MTWYSVDREIEATLGQNCQRALVPDRRTRTGFKMCSSPAVRTLRITARARGQEFPVGAYGFCDPCADDARDGRLVAFTNSLGEGHYAR